MKSLTILFLIICTFIQPTYDDLFNAIEIIEADDGTNVNHIGPYQISYAYWLDSGTPGSYKDCYKKNYSKLVMVNYWRRYNREALHNKDFETLSRLHYGGPDGPLQEETIFYWGRIKENL